MKRPLLLTLASGIFLTLSGVLAYEHLSVLRGATMSLSLAASVQSTEERAQVLEKQVQVMQTQSQLQAGTHQEQLRAYVLPLSGKTERTLGLFEHLHDALAASKELTAMSPITMGDIHDASTDPSLQQQDFSFDVTVTKQGRTDLLNVLHLCGLLTVSDALSREQIDHLFALSEVENYARIGELQTFLTTDLFTYARDPHVIEDRLLAAFSSERFLSELRTLFHASLLEDAVTYLGGDIGASLQQDQLWPTQLLDVKTVTVENAGDGLEKVHLEIAAYSRKDK